MRIVRLLSHFRAKKQGCGARKFLAAPAPPPGFFGVAPAPAPKGQKQPSPCGSGSPALVKIVTEKYFFYL